MKHIWEMVKELFIDIVLAIVYIAGGVANMAGEIASGTNESGVDTGSKNPVSSNGLISATPCNGSTSIIQGPNGGILSKSGNITYGPDGQMMTDSSNIALKGGQTITTNGSQIFSSNGTCVNRSGHMWFSNRGKSYTLSGSILSCSDGRIWSGVESVADAECCIKMDM